jgi:FkbM family methyltransferase
MANCYVPFKMSVLTPYELIYRAMTFWSKEPETLEWIRRFDSGSVFWDVGANVGCYSLYCAFVHPDSMVYAFEPHGANFDALVLNVDLNGWNANIVAENIGLSNEIGKVDFVSNQAEAGTSGGQIGSVDKFSGIGALVNVTTGDAYSSQNGVIPDYVKIDIDGQEVKVLEGMKSLLGNVKGVLVESTRCHNDILKIMREYGFSLSALNNKRNRSDDFNFIWDRAD